MKHILIKDIKSEDVGKEFILLAKVKAVRQTSGPTVFELKDNTGLIKATGFSKAGERAFPNIIIGDNIKAIVAVKNRAGANELEILSYEKTSEPVIKEVDNSKQDFMIRSENLEKFRPLFLKAADTILKAISESRPIIIRHHDDPDGYISGLSLEKAIKPLVEEANSDRTYLYFSRNSSKSPYYDYTDALRDLNNYLINKSRFNVPKPVIILADLGSNDQSINSIKRLKLYGIDFITVDHHRFDKANQDANMVFLNSEIKDFGSTFSAGILACELARFINPNLEELKHLPALSGTADRCDGKEFDSYLKLSGYDKKQLEKWALAIDHDLYSLKFPESSEILEDLFFPGERNEALIKEITHELSKEFEQVELAVKKYSKIEEHKSFKLISISKSLVGNYGEYASSKLTRFAHDQITGPRVTMVETEDSISFRADQVSGFSVVDLLEELKKKMPYALLTGGGHDYAGNIKFNPASKDEVITHINEYLKKIG